MNESLTHGLVLLIGGSLVGMISTACTKKTNALAWLHDRAFAYHRDVKTLHEALDHLTHIEERIEADIHRNYGKKNDTPELRQQLKDDAFIHAESVLKETMRGLKNNLPIAYAASKANTHYRQYESSEETKEKRKDQQFWKKQICACNPRDCCNPIKSTYYEKFPDAHPMTTH